MARINVYDYASPEGREYGEIDHLAGWFNDTAATKYLEATKWDGHNEVSANAVPFAHHQALYRTRGGRWVLNTWSQYEGAPDQYEFVSDERAREWLLINSEDAAVIRWFGELEEESGPSKGGRPTIGPAISVAYPQPLLNRIDAAATGAGVTRAEWLRNAAEHALQALASA